MQIYENVSPPLPCANGGTASGVPKYVRLVFYYTPTYVADSLRRILECRKILITELQDEIAAAAAVAASAASSSRTMRFVVFGVIEHPVRYFAYALTRVRACRDGLSRENRLRSISQKTRYVIEKGPLKLAFQVALAEVVKSGPFDSRFAPQVSYFQKNYRDGWEAVNQHSGSRSLSELSVLVPATCAVEALNRLFGTRIGGGSSSSSDMELEMASIGNSDSGDMEVCELHMLEKMLSRESSLGRYCTTIRRAYQRDTILYVKAVEEYNGVMTTSAASLYLGSTTAAAAAPIVHHHHHHVSRKAKAAASLAVANKTL